MLLSKGSLGSGGAAASAKGGGEKACKKTECENRELANIPAVYAFIQMKSYSYY